MHDPYGPSSVTPTLDRALTPWLTGMSGAGKSSLARSVCDMLLQRGISTDLLDSDRLRPLISPDLTFSSADRIEHARHLTACALEATSRGKIAVVCAVSPSRAETRLNLQPFVEIFVDAPVSVCERRDPLGLYSRFRKQELHGLAGLDAPYDAPRQPEVHCQTHLETIEESTQKIVGVVLARISPEGTSARVRLASQDLGC